MSQELIATISSKRPAVAKLIGLSAGKREDILNGLTCSGWEIRLLIQHPTAAMNLALKQHLEEKIRELANVTFIDYEKVDIRLYSRPCFIRGTMLGRSEVAMGWYACGQGAYELFGHSNPVVMATKGSIEAERLRTFFDRAFDYLWNHPETITLGTYLESTTVA